MSNMIQKKSWEEFRNTGLLLIINQLLHVFGWAIVVELDDNNNVINCYPARVKFRGFDSKNASEAYMKVSQYMSNNHQELIEESKIEIDQDTPINSSIIPIIIPRIIPRITKEELEKLNEGL